MDKPVTEQPTDNPGGSTVKSKKRKLTKEEKKVIKLEKKRLKALEKIEKEKQVIRDQLNRELKYSNRNNEKITRDWLKFMNQLKSSELKRNLEETWAEFKYISDRKDNYIEKMINDRMELEEKFQWDGEKHLELVNYLIGICNSLAKSLTSIFEAEVNHMLSEYQNEEYRKHVNEERKIYLENIFHATTSHAIDTMIANRNKFLKDASDLNITHIVQRDAIRDTIVTNMNKVYDQMMSLYDDVKSNSQTSDRVKVYQELMKQEQMHHENLKTMQEKTDIAEKEISILKEELNALSIEHKKVLTEMNNEKQSVSDKFKKITIEFAHRMEKDKEMLKFLVVNSEKTLTELRSLLKKGKNIFEVAQLCKKFKTEKETLQPWDDRVFETNEAFKNSLDGHNLKHLSKMDLFWYRTSLVKTANHVLAEEKFELQKENNNLQQLLRNYFQQQAYKADIDSLKLNKSVTAITPTQEASQMFKRKK